MPITSLRLPTAHPKCADPRYDFLALYAEYCGTPVERLGEGTTSVRRSFHPSQGFYLAQVNGRGVLVDFGDLTTEGLTFPLYKQLQTPPVPIVKMHYYPEDHPILPHMVPLGPWMDLRSVQRMQEFFTLAASGPYTCNSDRVLNNQRPHSRALERRQAVQTQLKAALGEQADCSYSHEDQPFFWRKVANCLVSVVVGGACGHMIDRGHMEQLALGVCCIFSGHSDLFCGGDKLLPWKHYLPVHEDYSNLLERIAWARTHREICRQIGQNARTFWLKHAHPSVYLQALADIVEAYYGTAHSFLSAPTLSASAPAVVSERRKSRFVRHPVRYT